MSESHYSIREVNALAESLLSSLQKEMHVYRELLELLNIEREILRSPSLESLNSSNSKKEACLNKSRICRQNTEKKIKEFKHKLPIGQQGEINLSLISRFVEGDVKQRLLDCRGELHVLLTKVRDCNERNEGLLRDSMDCTRATLTFIQTLTSSPMSYMSSGQLNLTMPNGNLLNRKG